MREAEVSQATFERYFRDLRGCFLAAYDAALGALLDAAQEAAASARESSARTRAALRFLLERLAAEPALARACLVELPRAGPGAPVHEDRALERLTGILQPRAGAGATAPAGELVDELVAGGVWETIRATLVRGSPADLPGLLPELHAWVTHGQRPAAGSD